VADIPCKSRRSPGIGRLFRGSHGRRRIAHFGVTAHPTTDWIARQIREAFPWDTAPQYLIRDRDGAYGQSFRSTAMAMGVEEVVTAPVAKSVFGTPDRQREARMY